jgi:hypothetical protein
MDNKVFYEIQELLHRTQGIPKNKITKHSSLEDDLGVTGNDAEDFMELFVENFKVDYSGFDTAKYFSNEGFDLLGITTLVRKLLGSSTSKKSSYKLTVRDLEDWVIRGYWKDPK